MKILDGNHQAIIQTSWSTASRPSLNLWGVVVGAHCHQSTKLASIISYRGWTLTRQSFPSTKNTLWNCGKGSWKTWKLWVLRWQLLSEWALIGVMSIPSYLGNSIKGWLRILFHYPKFAQYCTRWMISLMQQPWILTLAISPLGFTPRRPKSAALSSIVGHTCTKGSQWVSHDLKTSSMGKDLFFHGWQTNHIRGYTCRVC